MLTPVNAQITSRGSTSANTKGSDSDNGFGALLNDTKARRQSDTEPSKTGSAASRRQARAEDAGLDSKGSALHKGSDASIAGDRKPVQAGSARQTLSSALEQLQGNRLESREHSDETGVQRGTDRARSTLANQKGIDESRQPRLAALADGRRPLETLGGDRSSRLTAADKQTSDIKADALNARGKRLSESDQTDSAASLYGLIDTGSLMQTSLAQNAPAGREGALPARRSMLEQNLRGREATALDGTQDLQKGQAQEGARGERLFGELFSQREGPLFRSGSAGADATSGTQTIASETNDSPLNTLSALTGQSGAGSMAPGVAQAVTTATLPAMDSDQWSSAFERQVINLSMRGGGEARLNMNPLELGPLSISLKMGEQSAQLHIASHHAQVRAAIEAALPQLRDAFSASGIELGQTSVSDQGSFQQGGFQQQQERTPEALASRDASSTITGIDTDADVISISALPGRSLNGGIDLFA
ncbi:flagellar hook-length control protein FliK [uncultured Kushneria sp.]|uniref:flagellar hook-length control protein FliK n=1 Tax=uncultured Kushneria sp. TaxID=905033 RepID=UPI00262665C6|nr:flagellar hook-length control protein FliK [uncultured Kushneria sp.]